MVELYDYGKPLEITAAAGRRGRRRGDAEAVVAEAA